jgi:hypothetical protein
MQPLRVTVLTSSSAKGLNPPGAAPQPYRLGTMRWMPPSALMT